MLAVVFVLPATASASGDAVIQDCLDHGRLTHTYSREDLLAAQRLPADASEYSNCPGVIASAVRAASLRTITKRTPSGSQKRSGPSSPSGSSGSSGSSGPTRGAGNGATPSSSSPSPSTPGSRTPDARTVPPVPKGPSTRHPAVLPSAQSSVAAVPPAHASRTSSGLDALPTPLLVLLVALLVAAIAGAALSLRGRPDDDRRWSDVLRRGA